MENIQYTLNNKYVIISQNRIQSRKYKVNKIVIGTLVAETAKTLVLDTGTCKRGIHKKTIRKMINIDSIDNYNTLFFIERIEGALV